MPMPRGQELARLNAKIKGNFPKTCMILSQCLCERCCHRGRYRGCSFGFVPVAEDGLHSCSYFRQWGDWRQKPGGV